MASDEEARTRLRAWTNAVVLIVALLASAGCVPVDDAGHGVAVVVAAHDNELGATLGAGERDEIAALAADPDVDGVVVHVLAAGRAEVVTVDVEPRRPNGDIERGPRIDELVAGRMAELDRAIADAAAQGTATDPLPALDAAARTGAGRIVLLTAGLGLTGPLDVAAAEWDRDPAQLVADAAAQDRVPELPGRLLVISGLGRTTGEQEDLGVAEQRWLRELWSALCAGTQAECRIDDTVRPAAAPTSTVDGPVVDVPEPMVHRPVAGGVVVEVPAALLFGPDSCAVPDEGAAARALGPVADLIGPGSVVHVSGRTAPVGSGDGTRLSTCRAERAVDLLLDLGVPAGAIGDVTGDGHRLDPPGPADPTRLAGLRRVVFTVEDGQDQS